jgi:internalin A
MSELALKLIAENKKTKSKSLDLGNCGLTEVPEEVGIEFGYGKNLC